jgi:RNA polymerase sigma-70 factor (ECF subfamily)
MVNEVRGRAAVIDEHTGEKAGGCIKDGDEGQRAREEILIRRCIEGDAETFRPLVDRYSPSLHSFVARFVGTGEDACEIVQEAFLRAYRSLPDYDPRYRFSTWLYTITLNLSRDHLKRIRTRPADLSLELDEGRDGVEDPIEDRIDAKRRCEAALALMDDLPAKYREPLILKDVQRMGYREIAKVTGMSVGLLKIRVMRARRRLAAAMRSRGLSPVQDDERKNMP